MASKGWICVHRCIQDCSIWESNEPYDRRSAWIDLLLSANHDDKLITFNGGPMTIKRGQYLTSVRKLAERWNWSNDRTLRYLRLLESLGMIHKDSDRCRTLLTIENYSVYQDVSNTDKDTNKNTGKDTNKSQTTNKQLNNETISNKARPKSIEEVIAYCQERGNKVDPQKWYDYYSSNGWKVGKNPMKDWKASVRTWEKNSYDKPKQNKFNEFNQNSYDFDALEREITKWIAQ